MKEEEEQELIFLDTDHVSMLFFFTIYKSTDNKQEMYSTDLNCV